VHPKYLLVECVLRGIGFHYANIPTQLRQEIELAFADGELKYLVCTSTLLQGVNLDSLIPLHPSDPQAFNSYSGMLELCHEIILDIDTSKKLHRFHALLARRWMLGWSIPRIISERIKRDKNPDIRKIIRSTLEAIEDAIRFQTIRLFGCYKVLLEFALSETDADDRVKQIPDVELFLEIGASNKTTVSFIYLGLSRALAIRLTGARQESAPELGVEDALRWLRMQSDDWGSLGLSPLQIEEVKKLLRKTAPEAQN